MGEFKAGKSTLLNAWLGSNLLPTGVRPTTSLPCLLRHGSKPSARIVYASGRDETVLPENLRRYVDEFGRESAQKTEPQEKAGRKKAQEAQTTETKDLFEVSHVEIFLPIPQLSEVWFVDTPGLNSQFSAHNRYTETFAAKGDAFIWVLDATQLGRESEFSAFRRMVPPGKKVISVLNRIDEVNPEEIPDLISEASRLLGISKEDVIPVSARDALQSKMDPGLAISGVNKFNDFSRLLNIELFEHAWAVKASSLKQRIHGLFHEILSAREKETRELDELQDGLRNSREILAQRFADWTSISFPSLVEKAFSGITEKMRVMSNFAKDAQVFPNPSDNPEDILFQKALSEESGKILDSFREWFIGLSNEIFPFWRKTRGKISSAELFVNSGVIEGAIISRVNLLPDLFQFSLSGKVGHGKTPDESETENRKYRYFLEAIFSNWKNNFTAEVGEVELLMTQGNYYFEDRLAEHSAYLRFSAYDPVIRMKKLFP